MGGDQRRPGGRRVWRRRDVERRDGGRVSGLGGGGVCGGEDDRPDRRLRDPGRDGAASGANAGAGVHRLRAEGIHAAVLERDRVANGAGRGGAGQYAGVADVYVCAGDDGVVSGCWSRAARTAGARRRRSRPTRAAAGPPPPTGEWFVAPGASGNGSSSSPFGKIEQALDVAQPGQTITVLPGTYNESLERPAPGSPGQPIVLRSAGGRGSRSSPPPACADGRHAHFAVEGRSSTDSTHQRPRPGGLGRSLFRLSNSELRRTSRDLVDMLSVEGCGDRELAASPRPQLAKRPPRRPRHRRGRGEEPGGSRLRDPHVLGRRATV